VSAKECNFCGFAFTGDKCPECGTSYPPKANRSHRTNWTIDRGSDDPRDIDASGGYSNARAHMEGG
jgi:hypothetical protein